MGNGILAFIVSVIFFYQLYCFQEEKLKESRPMHCLILGNQEERIEGLLRYLVQKTKSWGIRGSLVVWVGQSTDQTALIVKKMAQDLSFIVREINYFSKTIEEEELLVFTTHEKTKLMDEYRKIQAFLRKMRDQEERNKQQKDLSL